MSNHSWSFTRKIPQNDPNPNYWFKCSKCGAEGYKYSPDASIQIMAQGSGACRSSSPERVTHSANPPSEQKNTDGSEDSSTFAILVASGIFGYWAFHGGGVWVWVIFIFCVLGFIGSISEKK